MDFSENVGGIGEGSDPFMKASRKGRESLLKIWDKTRERLFFFKGQPKNLLRFCSSSSENFRLEAIRRAFSAGTVGSLIEDPIQS